MPKTKEELKADYLEIVRKICQEYREREYLNLVVYGYNSTTEIVIAKTK